MSNHPVGIWIRVSTEMQTDSPVHQEKRCRDYVHARGWAVAEVYRLEGVSGAVSLEHPEAQRMFRDLETGRLKALVATRFARMARDGVQFRQLYRRFKEAKVDLISLDENIDTSTPAGELMLGLIADLAEWERKEIAARVKASIKPRAQLGKPLGGQAPYGYQWVEKQLIPHPQESTIRKLIHQLFIQHQRKKTVARLLNEQGHRTRRGNEWTDASISWLLCDPSAKGLHRMNYSQSPNQGQARTKDAAEVVWRNIPPIVSEELWEEAYQLLMSQKSLRKPPTKQPKQLFSGFVFCDCGRKMYVRSHSAKYTCYGCNNKIGSMTLEEAFVRRLDELELDISSLVSPSNEDDQQKQLLASCMAKERELEQQLKTALIQLQKGTLQEAAFKRITEPIQKQWNQLQEEIPRLEAELAAHTNRPVDAPLPTTLAEAWAQLDFGSRRLLVEATLLRCGVSAETQVQFELVDTSSILPS